MTYILGASFQFYLTIAVLGTLACALSIYIFLRAKNEAPLSHQAFIIGSSLLPPIMLTVVTLGYIALGKSSNAGYELKHLFLMLIGWAINAAIIYCIYLALMRTASNIRKRLPIFFLIFTIAAIPLHIYLSQYHYHPCCIPYSPYSLEGDDKGRYKCVKCSHDG